MRPISIARDLNRAGVLLTGGAAVAAEAGWLHMRSLLEAYGAICGSGFGLLAHCPACYVSAGLLSLAAACFLLARQRGLCGPRHAHQTHVG